MREASHDDFRYTGQEGEEVTIIVEPTNTRQIVLYTLKGEQNSLAEGDSINFSLEKPSEGGPMVLQMTFDYSGPSKGRYRVVISEVENEPNSECEHTFKQRGSLLNIQDIRFFIS